MSLWKQPDCGEEQYCAPAEATSRSFEGASRFSPSVSKEMSPMRTLLLSALVGVLGWGLSATPTARAADETAGKDAPVLITVTVPGDAQIWFEGSKTTQTGTTRQFVSPALKPGLNYTYTLRVRRSENGRDVDETRKLSVRAGESVTLNFGGTVQTNYYYSPTVDQGALNRIIYRNYYPAYSPTYYDSGYYPNYSSGSYSGASQPSWVPIQPHRPLSD